MLNNLKSLVVVLFIGLTIFALAKPLMARYADPVTYVRRRNVWIIVTALGFTMPSIWLYALIVMPLLYIQAKKDSNPVALYVIVVYAIPHSSVQIPTIGIGQLFDLNQPRMLAFAILMPLMFRRHAVAGMSERRGLTYMDWCVLGLGLLQIALAMPYDSVTNSLRRATVYFLDIFAVFYVFARVAPVEKTVREIIACIVLMAALLSGVAIFESFRGWLLYIGIGPVWGAIEPFTAYILRGGLLRAQASLGHSLTLGYYASLGLGLWFYLSARETAIFKKSVVLMLLCAGVFVSGSRGAWITSFLGYACYVALRPNAGRYLAKALPVLIVAFAAVYMSPLKESVIDKLPIIGTSDQDTVEYRQQIAEVSWRLIQQNPFFGDPFALRNMQALKQGQGIVDIMNGYANVAVFSGGVGFALFVGTFAIGLGRTLSGMVRVRQSDPDMAALGATLIACMVSTLFFIGTAAIDLPAYWLTGLLAAYSTMAVARLRSRGSEFGTYALVAAQPRSAQRPLR